jgi:16S rRNA (uracil1498-N3)-methyltransferase
MSVHRVYRASESGEAEGFFAIPAIETPFVLRVSGEEAKHALRVKRLEHSEAVEVLDGQGHVGVGRLIASGKVRDEWWMDVEIARVRLALRVRPRVRVWSAIPKGPRLGEMIDMLSQVGAASWGALESARSVSEPSEHKVERLRRVAEESSKQCGRAWRLEIEPAQRLHDRLKPGPGESCVVMADASGRAMRAIAARLGTAPEVVDLLIGPEGGWTADELGIAREAGAWTASFGPHVMRIETAGPIAVANLVASWGEDNITRLGLEKDA